MGSTGQAKKKALKCNDNSSSHLVCHAAWRTPKIPMPKKCQTALTSPHVVWEGFKKNSPHSSKNNLQRIQLSNTTGTLNGTGFYGQMKLKKLLLSIKHSIWVWWTQGKKVPHVYNEIYCCISNVVGLYFCWRFWTSCLDTWHHGFYQIPTDKKSTSDWLC